MDYENIPITLLMVDVLSSEAILTLFSPLQFIHSEVQSHVIEILQQY